MEDFVASHDWAATPLGPMDDWPPELRIAVRTCLRCEALTAIYWGPDFRLIYNDATIPVLGAKHPGALGRPTREVWIDTWPTLEPQFRQVIETGREVLGTNRRFGIDSQGRRSESYFNYSFMPIVDGRGTVLGILGQGRETTALVAGERWLRSEREKFASMFEHAPGFFAFLQGPQHVVEFINGAATAFIGGRDVVGRPIREAVPEIEGQGFFEKLDEAYAGGTPIRLNGMPARIARTADGPAELAYVDLVFQPVEAESGKTGGILVQGSDVTDRVNAAAAAHESEEIFRLIAERAPVMLWMSDRDGHCLYLNKSLRDFWGVAEQEVRGFDWTPTIHPDDLGPLWEPWLAGMKSRAGFAVEARYRRADGEYRILNTTAHPRFDAAGAFIGMIGVNVDVTETRKIEEALRQETRLLEVLNHAGSAIAGQLDLEKLVQLVTDAGVELTGAEFGAFFYNVTDDKGERYTLYTLSGAPREAFATFPMPRNTAVFRQTFEGTGIVRSDDILAHHLYGQSPPYHGMPPGHLPVRSYLAVPVTSRTGEVLGGLFFGHKEPGRFGPEDERLLSGIAAQAAVAIDNAQLLQSVERENEQRAAAEARLKELNETLEARVAEEIAERRQAESALLQAQKMEAIGQLTGGIAHDFNNLLQVIAGNLQLLGKDIAGNERAGQRVASALAGVDRGAKLASQLLAFGRRQPLEPRTINVGRLVSSLDEMLRRTLGERVEIETRVAAGLWNCFVDPSQTENALLNLAINARDAMPDGGRLTVAAANAVLDDAAARANPDAVPGEYVKLSVADSGSGIPPEVLARVFEPFFSTKSEGRGTGLGLSMVYGFVRQSGGHVQIESTVGAGTTVTLYLPRTLSAEEAPHAAWSGPLQGGSETVLVAEDDEGVRITVIEMLEELGYRVLEAPDAAAALARLESGEAVDLLFTDVVMPGPLRSPELGRTVRERFPGVAVLFTSGYAENSIAHGGKLDPGVALLPKPYTRETLARKLRSVLDRADRAAPAPSSSAASAGGRSLLFVEDDALIRLNTVELLRDLGHRVQEAGSAEEALRLLAAGPIDVLITDLGLPGVSGDELARRARGLQPGIGVVFATGGSQQPAELGVPDAQMLDKPYDERGIARALAALNVAAGS